MPPRSLENAEAHCTFPLLGPQTRALTSVLRSTVLPRHLQPLHESSRGSAPPPASVTPWAPQGVCSASYWPSKFEEGISSQSVSSFVLESQTCS